MASSSTYPELSPRLSYSEESFKQDIITEFHGIIQRQSMRMDELVVNNTNQKKMIKDLQQKVSHLEGIIKSGTLRPDPEQLLLRRPTSSSLPTLPFFGFNTPKPSSKDLTHEWLLKSVQLVISDGIKHFHTEKIDAAIGLFHQALISLQESTIPPDLKKSDLFVIFYHIAKCYELKGNMAETIAQARLAIDHATDQNNEARALLALTFAKNGDYDEARKTLSGFSKTFKITRKTFTTFSEWHLAKAYIYFAERKFTLSFAQLLIVLKQNALDLNAITFLEVLLIDEFNLTNLNRMFIDISEINKKNPNPKLEVIVKSISLKISQLDIRRLSVC